MGEPLMPPPAELIAMLNSFGRADLEHVADTVKAYRRGALLDLVHAYGQQCARSAQAAALPVMPQEVRDAIDPFLCSRWPARDAALRIGLLLDWLRSQNLTAKE